MAKEKTAEINVRVSPADKKAISLEASKRGLSVSAYLRNAALPKTK
jgi:predicted DNA binding CopG/RHH family protein